MYLDGSVKAFFASIKDWGDAAGEPSFAYVALKTADGFELLQARLILGVIGAFAPLSSFSCENVRAGHFLLSEVKLGAEDFLANALKGVIHTPQGDVFFRANDGGQYGGYYQPFHGDGISTNQRIGVLTVLGGSQDFRKLQPALDWELKGATEPYDSLQELMNHYRVGVLRGDVVNIEVAALNIITVDLSTVVSGTECEIAVRMAPGADPAQVGVTYRVMSGGSTVDRGKLSEDAINWTIVDDGVRRGAAKFYVPSAAVVQVYAAYAGTVLHQGWIADPTTVQNPRRASYEAFDRGLSALSELLSKQAGRGNARELESGIAWLLWMLGFNVAHFGGTIRNFV